ncbi:MAG: leucyl aminopeptidase family protein, partial [bacterium]
MQFSAKTGDLNALPTGCLIIGVYEGGKLAGITSELDNTSNTYLAKILKGGAIDGSIGQSLLLFEVPGLAAERVLLIGLGAEKQFNLRNYRKALQKAARSLNEAGVKDATNTLSMLKIRDADPYLRARHGVEMLEDASYRFTACKSKADKRLKASLQKCSMLLAERQDLRSAERGLKDGAAIAAGVSLAKDLGNLPPNICTPAHLAEQAQALGKAHKLKVTVLEREDMEKLGMGSLLSVAAVSRQPPKLITIEYHGGPKKQKPVVLVGKGVT